MRIWLAALVLLFGVSQPRAEETNLVLKAQCSSSVECALQSVVSLLPEWPPDFSRPEEPEGSGIVVADGTLIATANHVLGPAKRAKIRTISGKILEATIEARDPATDIALLSVNETLVPFEFSSKVHIAEPVCAAGNSFGLDVSVTCGVVSALQLSGTGFNRIEDFVQTDASVNPGMSGGALIDDKGLLVGMLSAIFTRQSDANIGVNFAVSNELLTRVIENFERTGGIKHRAPGLLVRPSRPDKDLPFSGAEVVRVGANTAEERAGVLVGDIIVKAGERRIKRAGAYEAAVALSPKGSVLVLQIVRNSEMIRLNVPFD